MQPVSQPLTAEIVRRLSRHETICILVNDERWERRVKRVLRKAGVVMARVDFFHVPTDRVWTRDYCPIFVAEQDGTVALTDWHFNGWAKYGNWRRDARVPSLAAARLRLPRFDARWNGRPLVTEGGGIEGNGAGTLLSTEECYLDPKTQVRNPGFTRRDYEAAWRAWLGVKNVFWLGRGIAGDDTHGHVDDVARFVNRPFVFSTPAV